MAIKTAKRMQNVHRSFVREILKIASNRDVISFAGGLPNPRFIPVAAISEAIQHTLSTVGTAALQYCASEGHPPLRRWIADQYIAMGLKVSPDQILITTGSQQALDMLGKVMIDPGDSVIVENPTYIAALQSFGMYECRFHAVPMDVEGIQIPPLEQAIALEPKMLYCMPNFQNPSGISYSAQRRQQLAQLLTNTSTLLIEDDPYGRLRFHGDPLPPIAAQRPELSVQLGSFSKIISPGMRLGWICAPPELIDKLLIAKQAVDLHSENLGQWVMHRLVTAPDFENHLQAIRSAYGLQCQTMLDAIGEYLPPHIKTTQPEGGMFLWLTLPAGRSSLDLFHRAIEKGVAFVPGQAFHASGDGADTMRLNFSNCDPSQIVEGVRRLASAMKGM